jgi:phosphatidate cytidylyltransferase
MATRLITGVTLAVAVSLLLAYGPTWSVALLFIVAAGLCLGELYAMALPERPVERLAGVALGAGVLAVATFRPLETPIAFAVVVLAPAVVVLVRPEPLAGAAQRMLTLWGGLLYIGGTMFFGLQMVGAPEQLVLLCAVVFLGDTGAYFAGRALGRHKLYEKISPKKTIEGSIGGLAASVGGAFAVRALLMEDLSIPTTVGLAIGGGVLGQIGDLVESTLKRACGVKDSGTLLPGHGGMLDRVDGLIFAMPLFGLVLV